VVILFYVGCYIILMLVLNVNVITKLVNCYCLKIFKIYFTHTLRPLSSITSLFTKCAHRIKPTRGKIKITYNQILGTVILISKYTQLKILRGDNASLAHLACANAIHVASRLLLSFRLKHYNY